MKWGIITDTHDKVERVNQAIAIFEEEGCSAVFHCGDFESNAILKSFLNRSFQFHYVTDHNGAHDRKLSPKFRKDYLTKSVNRIKVALYHDTYRDCERRSGGRSEKFGVARAIESRKYDFVFYGHLHYFNFKRPSPFNPTAVLNAGGFYHDDLSTFVVMDCEAATFDLYYFLNRRFTPILRFAVHKNFQNMVVIDQDAAYQFALALDQCQWKSSDRCGYVFTGDEDAYWFNKNFALLYQKLGYESKPAFFY